MAYKEPFVYSMSKIGEDCDEKTIGLEVMEVIWKNDLPTGYNPRKSWLTVLWYRVATVT